MQLAYEYYCIVSSLICFTLGYNNSEYLSQIMFVWFQILNVF